MKFALLAAAAAATVATIPATAATYLAVYASTNAAAPFAATLYLTTSDTTNSAGTFDVTGINGYVDTDHVTAVTPNPSQPNAQGSADGLFIYDNTFSPTPAYVTNPGLLFTSATHEYNLFSDSPTQYELYQATNGGYTENSVGTLVVTQVPEPAAWALFVAGFGLIGAATRRRATTVAA